MRDEVELWREESQAAREEEKSTPEARESSSDELNELKAILRKQKLLILTPMQTGTWCTMSLLTSSIGNMSR